MAISSEDKADIKAAHGKALANKIARVTRDKRMGKYMKGVESEIHPDLHAFKNSLRRQVRRQNVDIVSRYKNTRNFIDKYGKKD